MTRDEIFGKVRDVLVDALAVDEEEVTPNASLVGDLGAESIDFLDIVFQLEKSFNVKIAQGELFPEGANITQDPRYVVDGRVTPDGLAQLKGRLPHVDFTEFAKDPQVGKVINVFTVQTIVNFMARKLNVA
ncbi:MAG TPA: acyl carrier protein [Phycisphaerales bacterium]|jgi:acyl carrier protein|nr:acyl carrier protein [Phycisphaerales bacterium]